jgi:dihydroorotase
MSVAPARIAGFPDQGKPLTTGACANIVIFDPTTIWVPRSTVSKSVNTPYFGRELTGRVKATIFQGAITHEG